MENDQTLIFIERSNLVDKTKLFMNFSLQMFYEKLYSAEPIQTEAMEENMNYIPPSNCFNEDVNNALTSSWTEEETLACVSKAPRNSSLGVDGIPYEILQILLQHPFFRNLFAKILNIALKESNFPSTWQQTVVVLLPKKGERSQLKNWRPISLICADAKIFTRLLATRVNEVLPLLIDIHQTGFMPERFIADNGATTRLIINIAERFKLPGIALLLDQEKAYDRVHPQYLKACLERFGFPSTLVTSILSLFFGTSLCINVNGFLTTSIQQARGLRQGDPLSPLLFNLAIEPFLRSIWSSSLISGFTFPRSIQLGLSNLARSSPPVKALAYANDVLVFLKGPTELQVLLQLVSLYGRASNAKLNRHKTLAVSLSGEEQLEWRTMLNANRILQWHDNKDPTAAIYLGYPLTSSTQQMSNYLDSIITKVKRHADILAQRGLSIQGRSVVANSLLLSRIWHSIRILCPPQSFFQRIRSIIIKFLRCKNFPSVKFQDCRRPRYAALSPSVAMAYPALMRYYICVLTSSPSAILPLLFSEKRSTDSKKIGCFQSMFRTLDHIYYKISWTDLNTSTAEELPLCRVCPALLTNEHTYQSPYWKSLLVKDVYGFNVIDGKLTPRGSFPSSQQRNRVIKYLDLVRTSQIAEEDFVLPLKSSPNYAIGGFISSFGFQHPAPQFDSLFSSPLPDSTPVEDLSTKWFRNLDMLPLDSLPPTYPRASKSSWNKFWHVSIPHPARTILWRLYHSKLPTRSRLHRIMPRYSSGQNWCTKLFFSF
ncbi:hypothetical protein G6F36_012411 [Rhizopus arrhizus]|nr:hypothetical protein G6F36_012411 [Rhizopus arrhizus]